MLDLLVVVVFIHQVVSDSLRPHGLQNTGFLCPLLSPRVYSHSCSLSRWCYHIWPSHPWGCLLLLPSVFPSIRDLLLPFHRSLRLCLFFFSSLFSFYCEDWVISNYLCSTSFIHSLLFPNYSWAHPLGFHFSYCIFQSYHFQLVIPLMIYTPLLRLSFSPVSRVF